VTVRPHATSSPPATHWIRRTIGDVWASMGFPFGRLVDAIPGPLNAAAGAIPPDGDPRSEASASS
jgi:hypothetical protein